MDILEDLKLAYIDLLGRGANDRFRCNVGPESFALKYTRSEQSRALSAKGVQDDLSGTTILGNVVKRDPKGKRSSPRHQFLEFFAA